ncbi:hypothetical protein SFRURICE_016881 [Spodoptera frugiperda]|nr:hypothetical protein SFRURICE_016881 [Spodoptera frugiperda]
MRTIQLQYELMVEFMQKLEYLWDQSNISGSSGPTVFLPHHSLFLTKPTLRQRLHQHHRSSIRGR